MGLLDMFRVQELKDKLVESWSENEKLKKLNLEYKEKNDELFSQLVAAGLKNKQLMDEVSKQSEKCAEMASTVETLQHDCDSQQAKIEKLCDTISELNENVKKNEEEHSESELEKELIAFFESKYGVRTKKYMLYENTDRVPNGLLESYIELLKKNGAQFLRVLKCEDNITTIQYVDDVYSHPKTFERAVSKIFQKYTEEHPKFQITVKKTFWGAPGWENTESVSYVGSITKYFAYFCFQKKYVDIVNHLISKEFQFQPEILGIPDFPDIAYFSHEMNSLGFEMYTSSLHKCSIWACMNQAYIPVIQINDQAEKIRVQYKAMNLLEASRYKQGIRLDIGHVARSSWEANVARVFRKIGIPYEYEREAFDLSGLCYTPDFFLPNNVIVEVKGFWNDESRKKVSTFSKLHPEYSLLPLDSDMYESLRLKYAPLIPEWEDNKKTEKGTWNVNIVGMKFCASKETLQYLAVGDELLFEREHDNAFDRNAVLVKTKAGDSVGHVCADWAAVFAPKMDAGMTYHAEILNIQRNSISVRAERSNFEFEALYDFFK